MKAILEQAVLQAIGLSVKLAIKAPFILTFGRGQRQSLLIRIISLFTRALVGGEKENISESVTVEPDIL